MWFKLRVSCFCTIALILKGSYGIHDTDDARYSKMPPIFKMDLYEDCVMKPNGIYCMTDFTLVSDSNSSLLNYIIEYSKDTRKHFNHSNLRRGICVSEQCGDFLRGNREEDLKTTLEECLNETYWKSYQLKTKLSESLFCNTDKIKYELDVFDILVAVIFLIIILANVVGSLYDFLTVKKSGGNKILMCFSLRRNVRKLLNPYAHLEEEEKRLKCLHGVRVLTMVCSMLLHATYPMIMAPESPHAIEKMYDNFLSYIIFNGNLVVQTFFIMSGFLIAYKVELFSAKYRMDWKMIPLGILLCVIRITPTYALVLLFTMTWMRFLGTGPLWQRAVGSEVEACRKYGWQNILYINNYFPYNTCMIHSWYLGASMHLFILGYFVCVLARRLLAKKLTLSVLVIIGTIVPTIQTYVQSLDAIMLMTPELINTYPEHAVFNNIYKTSHTNMSNFVLGIALAYFTIHCQRTQVNMEKFKKYNFLILLSLPTFIGIMLFGILFTKDVITSQIIKAIYAGCIKPIFGVCICVIIFGSIFKIEHLYRSILEWNCWQVPAKLSYSTYVIHMQFIRIMTGMRTSLHSISNLLMLQVTCGTILLSYIISVPFWILVEGPLIDLLKLPLKRVMKKYEFPKK